MRFYTVYYSKYGDKGYAYNHLYKYKYCYVKKYLSHKDYLVDLAEWIKGDPDGKYEEVNISCIKKLFPLYKSWANSDVFGHTEPWPEGK
jgi:hypothetical protein